MSYTWVDFAPTILGLMGVDQIPGLQEGLDDSQTFINKEKNVKDDRIVYTTASPFNDWTMATDGRYKLVLSCRETPCLIWKQTLLNRRIFMMTHSIRLLQIKCRKNLSGR